MNRVVLFELGSQDPEGATKFYANVFDWKMHEPNWDYWPVTTGSSELPGINGGIARSPKDMTQRVQITIQVGSIDETLTRAMENGAKPDTDKMDFGDFYLAYFFDPQDIRIGLIQYK